MATEKKPALTAAQEAELRRLRVIEAFKKVFGVEDSHRTDDQRIVWRELEIMGYRNKPVFVPGKDGSMCALRAAVTDGRRGLFADIEANVTFAPRREG